MLDTKFWRKYFKVYDILNELIPYQELANAIVDELDIKKKDKVLDVGSGTGNIALKIKEKGAVVSGIDISKEGVEIHRKKDPDAKLMVGDVSKKLPYSDNTFDKIYSNNTLYTIPREKRKQIFVEFYRVLKPGGKIVVSNVIEGFSPRAIYFDHIKKETKQKGIFFTLWRILFFIIPTIKIFYYNHLITKEGAVGKYDFFKQEEQKELLQVSGFVNISSDLRTYSDQAILNSAFKK